MATQKISDAERARRRQAPPPHVAMLADTSDAFSKLEESISKIQALEAADAAAQAPPPSEPVVMTEVTASSARKEEAAVEKQNGPAVAFQSDGLPAISAASAAAMPDSRRNGFLSCMLGSFQSSVPRPAFDRSAHIRNYLALTRSSSGYVEIPVRQTTMQWVRSTFTSSVKPYILPGLAAGVTVVIAYSTLGLPLIPAAFSGLGVTAAEAGAAAAAAQLGVALGQSIGVIQVTMNVTFSFVTIGKALQDPKKCKMRKFKEAFAEILKMGAQTGLRYATADLMGETTGLKWLADKAFGERGAVLVHLVGEAKTALGPIGLCFAVGIFQAGTGALLNLAVTKLVTHDKKKLAVDIAAQEELNRLNFLTRYFEPKEKPARGVIMKTWKHLRDSIRSVASAIPLPGYNDIVGTATGLTMAYYYATGGFDEIFDSYLKMVLSASPLVQIAVRLVAWLYSWTMQPLFSALYRKLSPEMKRRVDSVIGNQLALAVWNVLVQGLIAGGGLAVDTKFLTLDNMRKLHLGQPINTPNAPKAPSKVEVLVPDAAVINKSDVDAAITELFPEGTQELVDQAVELGYKLEDLETSFIAPVKELAAATEAENSKFEKDYETRAMVYERNLNRRRPESQATSKGALTLLGYTRDYIAEHGEAFAADLDLKTTYQVPASVQSKEEMLSYYDSEAAAYEKDRSDLGRMAEVRDAGIAKNTQTFTKFAGDVQASLNDHLKKWIANKDREASNARATDAANGVLISEANQALWNTTADAAATAPVAAPPPPPQPVLQAPPADLAGYGVAPPADAPVSSTQGAQISQQALEQRQGLQSKLMQSPTLSAAQARTIASFVHPTADLKSKLSGTVMSSILGQMTTLINQLQLGQNLAIPGMGPDEIGNKFKELAKKATQELVVSDLLKQFDPKELPKSCMIDRVGTLSTRISEETGEVIVVDSLNQTIGQECFRDSLTPYLLTVLRNGAQGAVGGAVAAFGPVGGWAGHAVAGPATSAALDYGAALVIQASAAMKAELATDPTKPLAIVNEFFSQLSCAFSVTNPTCQGFIAKIDSLDLATQGVITVGLEISTMAGRAMTIFSDFQSTRGMSESWAESGKKFGSIGETLAGYAGSAVGTAWGSAVLVKNFVGLGTDIMGVIQRNPDLAATVMFGSPGISSLRDSGGAFFKLITEQKWEASKAIATWLTLLPAYMSPVEAGKDAFQNLTKTLSAIQTATAAYQFIFGGKATPTLRAALGSVLTAADQQNSLFLQAAAAPTAAFKGVQVASLLDAEAATGLASWLATEKKYTVVVPDNETWTASVAAKGVTEAFKEFIFEGDDPVKIVRNFAARGFTGLDISTSSRGSVLAMPTQRPS